MLYVTNDLIRDHGDKEKAADFLVSEVINGKFSFPFHKLFIKPPEELFEGIKRSSPIISDDEYLLKSYLPRYNLYQPPLFRGRYCNVIPRSKSFFQSDVLSDYFIEEERITAKRIDQKLSQSECWNDVKCLHDVMLHALDNEFITPDTMRRTLYHQIAETRTFLPSWGKGILIAVYSHRRMAGKKWLDISAGWGDRLLTAMAMDIDYLGFDPNIRLQKGHSEMISMFGNPHKHRVIYMPFEDASFEPESFDFVLSSPPYFDLEIYSQGQKGQSIESFPKLEDWITCFLFVSIKKAWDAIKYNGYLILHLGDNKQANFCEAVNLYIETLDNSSWEGVIGVTGNTGKSRPVWVWKKSSAKIRWNPKVKRNLKRMYPELCF